MSLVGRNKADWNGKQKIIAGFGSGIDGFFVKSELLEIAQQLGLNLSKTLTRGQIASALLCQFKPQEESNQKAALDTMLAKWLQKKNKQTKNDKYLHKQWTPFARNVEHQNWFSRNVKTFEDFSNYMVGVLTKYLPSPFYDFQPNDKLLENQSQIIQKDLWSNNDDVIDFLVEINKTLKFTTVKSRTLSNNFKKENCDRDLTSAFKDVVYENRAYVIGIMNKNDSHEFVREMNKRNFIALCVSIKHKHTHSIHGDDFGFTLHSEDLFENKLFSDQLKTELMKDYEYVFVLDPKNHRVAEEVGGLFDTVYRVFTNGFQLDDGDEAE